MRTKPIPITWRHVGQLNCVMLGSMGMSTKYIMEETGLTACQVSYQLRMAGIKRADYRNGTSAVALRVMQRVIPGTAQGIRDVLGLKVKGRE